MKLLSKLAILCLFACLGAWGQCGAGGVLILNPLTGGLDCTGKPGAGSGTVTSVGLAGTTNQITVTGTTPITATGTWTLSLPSGLLFPGLVTFAASAAGGAGINIPSGTAPTVPNSGDFWNQSGVLHFYDGTTNQSLVFQSRAITTTSPLGGGGTLAGNLTFTCATCTTNAAALTANQLIIGGGGQASVALGSLGTTTTLLHGNAAGAPTFGNVADGDFGTNILGVAHGGLGIGSGTSGGVPCFTGSTTISASAALTANLPLIGGGAGVCPSVGTVTGNTTQFATSTGTQTSTAVVKIDASGNHIASGCTIDASNNFTCPGSVTGGSASGKTGYLSLQGATSGAQGFTVADVAGTSTLYLLPSAVSSGNFLKDNGSTTCPTLPAGAPAVCEALAWASPTGSGTVNSATAGQLYYNSAGGAVATGNANATISAGALTLGVAGSAQGSLVLSGSTSGTTTIAAQASGGGTMTLQAGSDTLVGRATTDTLTNKTYDTAGTGNVFKINGTQVTAIRGNTATVQMNSGALTSGNLLSADANANAVDSGVVAGNAVTASAAAAAAKAICVSGGASKTCTYIDFPDVKIIPAANCNNGTAGAGWNIPATNAPTVACRAGTNNLDGELQWANNNTTTNAQFEFELPEDWDTASQPFIQIFYGSGANTAGTVKWTFSTACAKQDGSVSDDPAFVAETATTGKTMAVANRMWAESIQFTAVTSGNNCVGGSEMLVKITSGNGTATSTVNVYKVTLTVPRLLTVQAN